MGTLIIVAVVAIVAFIVYKSVSTKTPIETEASDVYDDAAKEVNLLADTVKDDVQNVEKEL
jgi:hypothetical protein